MRPLTSRERKAAALGVLALLLWALWHVLIAGLFLAPLRTLNEQTDVAREQQRRYARLILQQPTLAAQLKRTQDDPAQRNRLLSGDDPNAVAIDLMQHVVERVSAQSHLGPGCEVTQRRPIAAVEQDQGEPYRQVNVSLTLACAIEPLAGVLHDLEYGQPTLFVDQLSVRRPVAAPAQGGAGRLEVQLLVRGYLRAARSEGGDS